MFRWLRNGLSISLAIVALGWVGSRVDLAEMRQHLRQAHLGWLALGAGVFWLSLPLRGWRWQMLFRAQGEQVPVRLLTLAILQAWTVNCSLPGRAGDLYSSFVIKAARGLSKAFTLGTILGARVFDLLTLVPLVTILFLLTARGGEGPVTDSLMYAALALGALVLLGLLVMRRASGLMQRWLPERFYKAYGRFVGAAFPDSRRLPMLLLTTLLLWCLEAGRLWCVLGALDAPRPPVEVAFFSLVAAVLTTLPITPGGLGGVELFYQQALPLLGITTSEATSAAFLDRFINYWLILAIGGPYVLSQRAKVLTAAAEADPDEEE